MYNGKEKEIFEKEEDFYQEYPQKQKVPTRPRSRLASEYFNSHPALYQSLHIHHH
jgi:hypothetical protein